MHARLVRLDDHLRDGVAHTVCGEVRLTYEGEIRFGPPFCTLSFAGSVLCGRTFGDALLISASRRYIAAVEWHTTRESDGPDTSVVLFDLLQGSWTQVWRERVLLGLAELNDETVVYRTRLHERTTKLRELQDWKQIGSASVVQLPEDADDSPDA